MFFTLCDTVERCFSFSYCAQIFLFLLSNMPMDYFLYFLYKRIKKAYRLKDVSFYHEETYKAEWNKMLRYFIKPIAIIVMAMVVLFINPVSDIIYYSAVVIGMGIMLWTMLDLINIQNKLLMRPLPQFNTRGGDEDAYKML